MNSAGCLSRVRIHEIGAPVELCTASADSSTGEPALLAAYFTSLYKPQVCFREHLIALSIAVTVGER